MKCIMNRFCLLLVLTGVIAVFPVDAYQVEVLPSAVLPGEAFLVKVTDLVTTSLPKARFKDKRLLFSSCGSGCFMSIAAVDIRTKPGRYTVNVAVGTQKRPVPIAIHRHDYPVSRITLPPDQVSLSDEALARVEREGKLLKMLWMKRSERMWDGAFAMPLAKTVSTHYGVKRIMNGSRESIHQGIDIRGSLGDEVKASNSGTVVLAEELYFGGNTLIVDHGMGIYTVYMHLSRFAKLSGDGVSKGETIGYVGSTGRSTGPHLHFGVKVQELSVNPLSVMKLKL